MTEAVKTKHIALLYSDRKKAELFFNKILGIELSKSFTLSEELSNKIFNISETYLDLSHLKSYLSCYSLYRWLIIEL